MDKLKQYKWIDFSQLNQITTDTEFITYLLKAYVEDTEKMLIQSYEALSKEDYNTIKYIAHTIKGASNNLGLYLIADIAKNIELSIQKDQINDVADHLTNLKKEFDNFKTFLE
ncbi:MAG: Hpt domain-containing protein [Deferribacterales bacterium]